MDGLPNNYAHDYVMNEWYRLFKEQNNNHSTQRDEYWKRVQECGLPNMQDEKWKHIPLNKLFSHIFINSSSKNDINQSHRNSLSLNIKSYRLVFINGFFSKKLSTTDIGPWKINIINRNAKQSLLQPIKPEVFLYLTECLNHEIVHITLPNNKKSQIPLYLLYINKGIDDKKILNTIHYRHHIEIHSDSSAQIIEHHTSTNNNSYFSGSRMSMIIGNNTTIQHTKLSFDNRKSFHISYNDIHINYNSIVQSNIFNVFGSHLHSHQTNVLLNNKRSSLTLNSLSFPIEQDISSISSYVKHNTPGYNASRQTHKIISGNQGKGIFHGVIKVNKQAIKVDGKMINKNLLLHSSSQVISMPQLEIYSDDISCNHGATIGYMDHEQIFYLCTRGIVYQEAYHMIIYAFTYEIIEIINDNNIRKNISERINNILARTFCNDISHKKNSM